MENPRNTMFCVISSRSNSTANPIIIILYVALFLWLHISGICFLHDCSRTFISACLRVYHKFTHTYESRYHSEAYTKHRKRGNWIHAGAIVLAWPAFLEVSNVPPGPSPFATHLLPSSFDGPEQLYYGDSILPLGLSSALPKFSDDWWLLMSGPTLDPLCSVDFAMWKYFSSLSVSLCVNRCLCVRAVYESRDDSSVSGSSG